MNDNLLTAILIGVAVFLVGRMVLARMSRVSGAQARAEVEAGAVLVDVRTPAEFASGSIPGARNLPLDRLEGQLGELDKAKKVVVFCRSGMRSARAATILRRHGFTALDLGPVSAW